MVRSSRKGWGSRAPGANIRSCLRGHARARHQAAQFDIQDRVIRPVDSLVMFRSILLSDAYRWSVMTSG